MRAMLLRAVCSLDDVAEPLSLEDIPTPEVAPGEILIEVSVCGVCHTELDEIEGRTAPPSLPVVPGHEVVGRVAEVGDSCGRYSPGDRVGVGWIHHSDGTPTENVSPAFVATGRDVNGGYAEFMTVPEGFATRLRAIRHRHRQRSLHMRGVNFLDVGMSSDTGSNKS